MGLDGSGNVLRRFGLQLVRGAGAAGRPGDRGGAEAAHGLIASLREGYSMAQASLGRSAGLKLFSTSSVLLILAGTLGKYPR